ncbi:MAG: hypothetical protein HYY16_01005 [Planctomycetes bacterium]|nr:hypothetical protein [Planctomycetota bacterium]
MGTFNRLAIAVIALAPLGCRSVNTPAVANSENAVTFEVVFERAGHDLRTCAHGLQEVLASLPDGVLFYGTDSRIVVRVPREVEPYHAHVLHRVNERVVDHLIEVKDGQIAIDLAQVPEPELLVVTSASFAASRKSDRAIVPAYMISLRLARVEECDALVAVQDFRYDLKTPLGTAHLLVQPVNGGDMLLTLLDRTGRLGRLFGDSYIYYRPRDAYLVPKVCVDVADSAGHVWQRVGAWPAPVCEGAGAEPFALRTATKELVSFQPPALRVRGPQETPETVASVEGTVVGARPVESFHWIVAHAVPDDARYAYQVQSRELAGGSSQANATISMEGTAEARFPLTASVAYRLVAPWKSPGGCFTPKPARKTVELSSEEQGLRVMHGNVMSAAHASHYAFIRFSGKAGAPRAVDGEEMNWNAAATSTRRGNTQLGASLLPGRTWGLAAFWGLGAAPPPGPSQGLGSGGCKCGQGGVNCPNTSNPCGGGCPNCQCAAPQGAAAWTFDFGCDCGMGKDKCTCDKHSWDADGIEAAAQAASPACAETAWYGMRGGFAPCHKETYVGTLRMSYWGVGAQIVYRYYRVVVTFLDCAGMTKPCRCGINGAGCQAPVKCNGNCGPGCACGPGQIPPSPERLPRVKNPFPYKVPDVDRSNGKVFQPMNDPDGTRRILKLAAKIGLVVISEAVCVVPVGLLAVNEDEVVLRNDESSRVYDGRSDRVRGNVPVLESWDVAMEWAIPQVDSGALGSSKDVPPEKPPGSKPPDPKPIVPPEQPKPVLPPGGPVPIPPALPGVSVPVPPPPGIPIPIWPPVHGLPQEVQQ